MCQSLGDAEDLATFQRQDRIITLKYVVLTCGRILADHNHAMWRQRIITDIQSYRALKLLHPNILPSHISLIPPADKGQLEAIVKYSADNQLTEKSKDCFKHHMMQCIRRGESR